MLNSDKYFMKEVLYIFQEQKESETFCQMRRLMPLRWWLLQTTFNLEYDIIWLLLFIYF